jgi:hypothetical protein
VFRASGGLPRISGWTATGIFALLTVVFTWPQAVRLLSVPDSLDTTFSMWRIAWIAHQLVSDPRHLFDANIFYPLKHTLAYSDAVLAEGLAGAPLQWIGVPTVIVYNLLVLAGFVLSALGAFLLVRDLTGSSAAGIVGGMIYAFAPFRFDHLIHLEMLWAQWIPLAMWMLHRTLQSGRWRDGLLTGLCVGLQGLSSVYYLVFFATILVIVGPILLTTAAPRMWRRAALSLAAGAVLAALMLIPYARAYQAASADVGVRERMLTMQGFSVGPRHYLVTTPNNILYGAATSSISVHERRLFMGYLVMALMVIGFWPPINRIRVIYALALAVCVDISFAHRGLLLGWLYDHIPIYQGLRVPTRIGQLALLCAAVLAGFGVTRVLSWVQTRRPAALRPAFLAICAIVGLEYLMFPLALVPMPTSAPASAAWLRDQPPAPVAVFPVPRHDTDWRRFIVESRYEFETIFHWRPLTNGYSGFLPPSFYVNNILLLDFPSDKSMARLRELGVGYAMVHERYYGRDEYRRVVEAANARPDLSGFGPFADGEFTTRIYRIESGTGRAQIARGVSVLKPPSGTAPEAPQSDTGKPQQKRP